MPSTHCLLCVCLVPLPRGATVGPLTKLAEGNLPMLFVCGEFDRLCPGSRLKETLAEALPAADARVVVLEVSRGQVGKRETSGSEPAGRLLRSLTAGWLLWLQPVAFCCCCCCCSTWRWNWSGLAPEANMC
jgi:hypothetical protein